VNNAVGLECRQARGGHLSESPICDHMPLISSHKSRITSFWLRRATGVVFRLVL